MMSITNQVGQVGQQFEILTGGRFLATFHVIEAPEQPGYTRTAMAHFVQLHSEQRLFLLSCFQTEESIRTYGPQGPAGARRHLLAQDVGGYRPGAQERRRQARVPSLRPPRRHARRRRRELICSLTFEKRWRSPW